MSTSTVGEESKCFCVTRRLFIHILDAATIIFIVGLQGGVLNYYLIRHYKDSIGPYFYILGDLFTMIVFAGTLTTSFTYLTKKQVIDDKLKKKANFFTPARLIQEVEINLPWSHRILGTMPFSYISWLVYVIIMLSKVVVIFQSPGLVSHLSLKDVFGPNVLKLTIALASLVFLSLVEGHNWSKRGSPRYAFVTSTCAKNGMEIFDGVAFLALQMEEKVNESGFKDAVLVLSMFTFILPTLSLFKLSLLDFASEKACLQVTVLQNVLRLTTVDLPFLAVRMYLWIYYRENASLFLMKNIFNIILISRTLCPDLKVLAEGHFGDDPQAGITHTDGENVSLNCDRKDELEEEASERRKATVEV
ncbi:uncharacterized protein LOC128991750 [Macrosteles quadrilineatus]|uniref:uncharacterized protein LOC128991750 n=1 Tax=Macrosteles quadrilineatus TaxID=74068 RepID=UPI0023E1C530|nr:uncharacterized protein LOC128991750 [Macrosteles quadrilineatus]